MKLTKENLKEYFVPKNFINRDLSWLEFNRRVLDEALNPDLPLLDKIKFISIFFTNLDEFYMIRVSGLKGQIRAKIIEPSIDGLNPIQELRKIEEEVQKMLNIVYDYWKNKIFDALTKQNIFIAKIEDLNAFEREGLSIFFNKEIYPVLTPLAFDPGRPFPYISNLSLSFAILVKNQKGDRHFARLKIPNVLSRLIQIDKIEEIHKNKSSQKFTAKFIWIDDLIKHNLDKLFPGLEIIEAYQFRITRDTDLEIQEDEADDLLDLIEENVKQRKFGSVVRLEVEKNMPEYMLNTLTENLEISRRDVHIIDGILGLNSIMKLYDLPLHQLKEKPFHPIIPPQFNEDESIFSIIKHRDLFLHHPYDAFSPVIDFIKEAAQDPDVLAIKQTLYRVGTNSPIVKYLIEAAERNKQVAVLVELKARFDEENNIFWARELEKAGVHVVYGLVGLKTHAKITLVVRKESDGVKRYVHLSTGNYNPITAKFYTDLGLFTSDEDICADVSEIFNYITGYSEQKHYRKLMVAPLNIRSTFLKLIEREINNVKKGGKGYLIFKMNSIVDPTIIAALYEASNAGVKIDLIVRGICCLRPGVPRLSENINVISIIGRFLEHSRIFYFYNNGKEELFVGSADLMQRNLDRRVEIIFPIESQKIKQHIINSILKIALKDNIKARVMKPNGKYEFKKPGDTEEKISFQDWLMKKSVSRGKSVSVGTK